MSSTILEEIIFLIIVTLSGTIWFLILNMYAKFFFMMQKLLKNTFDDIWMHRTIWYFCMLTFFDIWYSDQVRVDWMGFNVLLLIYIMREWDWYDDDRLMFMWWAYIFMMFVMFSILVNTFTPHSVIMDLLWNY